MGDFYSYLSVFLSQWWWFLTSGPYVLDPLLESMSNEYGWWKARHFSQTKWQRVKVALALVGIFFAGFFAWKDEHVKYQVSEGALTEVSKEVVALRAQPRIGEEAQAKINSLTQANQQLQQKVEVLEKQTLPRVLTDEQKKKLTDALSKVPPGITYRLTVHAIANCNECSVYTNDLGEVWKKAPGWEVNGTTNHGLDPRLKGVIVAVDIEGCPLEELHLAVNALDAAGIRYTTARSQGTLGSGICALVVGSKPQEQVGINRVN